MPEGSEGSYFIGRIRGGDVAAVGSIPDGAPPMATWNTYIWVDSADETAAKARDAGGAVVMEPFDVMDAGRMAVLADPEGAVFCVWQAKNHKGAKVVNEHGSLNFNGLATRDPEGGQGVLRRRVRLADRWPCPPVRCGRCPATAITSRRAAPGLREQMAQMGAPEGFIDVVAALNPIADDDSDTPAHWSVTFAVDDADATAAKAQELGGEVVAGPFDAPWTQDGGDQGPAGGDVHRQPVRPREQGPRGVATAPTAGEPRRRRAARAYPGYHGRPAIALRRLPPRGQPPARAVLALSGGRIMSTMGGMPMVELHTIGRQSGQRRSVMLTAPVYEADRVVLVASKGGDDHDPDWYRNLVADPDVEVGMAGETRPIRARTATDAERAELWPRIADAYRGYDGYQRRTDRRIPSSSSNHPDAVARRDQRRLGFVRTRMAVQAVAMSDPVPPSTTNHDVSDPGVTFVRAVALTVGAVALVAVSLAVPGADVARRRRGSPAWPSRSRRSSTS